MVRRVLGGLAPGPMHVVISDAELRVLGRDAEKQVSHAVKSLSGQEGAFGFWGRAFL